GIGEAGSAVDRLAVVVGAVLTLETHALGYVVGHLWPARASAADRLWAPWGAVNLACRASLGPSPARGTAGHGLVQDAATDLVGGSLIGAVSGGGPCAAICDGSPGGGIAPGG